MSSNNSTNQNANSSKDSKNDKRPYYKSNKPNKANKTDQIDHSGQTNQNNRSNQKRYYNRPVSSPMIGNIQRPEYYYGQDINQYNGHNPYMYAGSYTNHYGQNYNRFGQNHPNNQYGQNQYGQNQYGQNQYGQNQYGQNQFNQFNPNYPNDQFNQNHFGQNHNQFNQTQPNDQFMNRPRLNDDSQTDQNKLNKEKKSFNGVIGLGSKGLGTNMSQKVSKQNETKQNETKQNETKQNESKPKEFNPFASPFNPSGGPEIIKIDLVSDSKNGAEKQLQDIFKALLGVGPMPDLESDAENDFKLKIKEFDLSKDYIEIDQKVKTIDDLIKLANLYDESKPELMDQYTIDLKKLSDMKEPLIELQNLIGMDSVKKSLVNQILYFLQGIEEQQDMLHMVITGSPGTGKTSLGMILSKLYYSMGLLDTKQSVNPITGSKEKFTFKIYKRADLIGQYLGHTAIKTQKAIDECIGGVMFLDEAYSLGHDEKSDIYTKECLDTINQNLSENKKNFILIIAGYPDQLDKCFFSHNEGLKRRFAFRYHIDKYTPAELCKMLKLKIKLSSWSYDESDMTDEKIIKLIEASKDMFENFGGDIESWYLHIKIAHGVRIFGKHPKYRRNINMDDLKIGLENFKIAKENTHQKEKLEAQKRIIQTMYA